ncbi:hypothetical protein RN001_004839 [Aquatica leii]|uniref:Uncharacterized protein n=1 Tax=Aquatica leii TaxID=1421715 RepID=A0AAN7SRW6_9COLE|nr:hypothetical protein RN001_004839 [Aquatica leii]
MNTTEDLKHNLASTSRPTKKLQFEDSKNHNKKNEKPLNIKATEIKEKGKAFLLQTQLQVKNQECQHLKSQIIKLQKEVTRSPIKSRKERSTCTGPSNQTESCMTDIIIEKTRMLKNQELQIEALTQQVNSLKEVINITKDMLDIRNVEVKQLHDKLHCMEIKFDSEKDRHETVQSKLERMVMLNSELKNEYKKQLHFVSDLQKGYQEHLTNCSKKFVSDDQINIKQSVVDDKDINKKPIETLATSNATIIKTESLKPVEMTTNENAVKQLPIQEKGDTEIKNTPKSNIQVSNDDSSVTKTQVNNEETSNYDKTT